MGSAALQARHPSRRANAKGQLFESALHGAALYLSGSFARTRGENYPFSRGFSQRD